MRFVIQEIHTIIYKFTEKYAHELNENDWESKGKVNGLNFTCSLNTGRNISFIYIFLHKITMFSIIPNIFNP